MSYRLIDVNVITIKYPEVNEMDCMRSGADWSNDEWLD